MRPLGETLTALIEGPEPNGDEKKFGLGIGQWMKGQLSRAPSPASTSFKRYDLRLLLGVMGAPLAPVHVSATDPLLHLSIKNTPIDEGTTLLRPREQLLEEQRYFQSINNISTLT